MKLKYVTLAMLMTVTAGTSHAITIHEAASAILGRNGDRLQTELLRDAKNAETLSIANAPDPEVEGDYMVAPAGEDNRWGFGVSYGIEWPGAYGARRNLGKAMREANSAEADAAIIEKEIEILGELEAYLYAEMRLRIMNNVLAASDSIRAIAERSLKGGEMSRLDLSKIILEQSRVQSIIAGIETERIAIVGNLKTLNGGQSCVSLLGDIDRKWDIHPLGSLQSYLDNAKNNPGLLKVMKEFEVAERNVSVARTEGLPGFTVGYAHEFEDGMHFNGATLGVSMPLFSSRNKVKAAKAARAAAEYQMTVSADKLESQISSLYEEIVALDKALEIPMQVFKDTDYSVLLLKAYEGGELSLADYLSELSWFYEAHMEYMDLQYQRELKANRLLLLCK